MMLSSRVRDGSSCASAYLIDRAMAGELSAAQRADWDRHFAACARCRSRRAEHEAARASFASAAPPLAVLLALGAAPPTVPMAPVPARRVWLRVSAWTAPAVAAAAALMLLLGRADPTATSPWRTKGATRLSVFVRHGADVRQGAPGEVVAPGDGLQFAISAPPGSHVAVLSRDGAGRADAYFPRDGRTVEVGPSGELESTNSVVLDDTPGEEQLYVLVCAAAVDLGPIVDQLHRGAERPWPNGCSASSLRLRKPAPFSAPAPFEGR